MKTLFFSLLFTLALLQGIQCFAQTGVAINNTGADAAGSAMLDVSSLTKGVLIPRMTAAQRTAIVSPVKGLLVYQDDGTEGFYYYGGAAWTRLSNATGTVTSVTGNAPIGVATGTTTPVISIAGASTSAAGSMSAADKTKLDGSTHVIGEHYGGGIVFYVYDGGRHGLIAAETDQHAGIQWYNGTNRFTGASGKFINDGAMNTAIIVATQMADNQSGNFAAKVCSDYVVTGLDGVLYGDWYLPSLNELAYLLSQQGVVGGLTGGSYWSSSDYWANEAWYCAGGGGFGAGKNDSYRVRAVRAF